MALILGGGGETGFEDCLLQPRDHNLNFFDVLCTRDLGSKISRCLKQRR